MMCVIHKNGLKRGRETGMMCAIHENGPKRGRETGIELRPKSWTQKNSL